MSNVHAVSPTSEEIYDRLRVLQHRSPHLLSVSVSGTTAQGRPILTAELTDHAEPDADKQHALIVAGQHGNEETSRLVALRLIDYLLGANGRPLLKRQNIVVMPNVSPDAAEADSYETPDGIKPNLDHGSGRPKSPEARALRDIADALQPDLYVDMHARGHSGWSHDMVLFPAARAYTEDEHLLHEIAAMMAAEGEKSGIPHVVHPLTWPGWGGTDPDQPSSTLYMYRRFKSIVLLTESAESHDDPDAGSYPARTRAAAGVNRLKPLLELGSRRRANQFYGGYPTSPVVGMNHAGIVAVGATTAQRRASRVALWPHAAAFESVTPVVPEKQGLKRLLVRYTGPCLATGAGFQVRAAGRLHVRSVHINGTRLRAGESSGFYTWRDKHTTFAVAALPSLKPGEHEVVFQFQ